MAYIRKTRDQWDIDTNYGYGWETESSYDSLEEARRDIIEYKRCLQAYGGTARIVKRRIRKEKTE